ncbi:SPOR domain-containing protein [Methylorubrum sp. SB2]|uniref:SPOR domain-containing protein n=1 Tax=Methylorubrum subtropicum TaxID=3138812 RepID=UPI00313D9427
MTGHASRATVDFDAFERELRHSTGESGAPKADPLAELARIVGQDDPFRALLEAREKSAAPAPDSRPGRVEPTFLDAPAPAQDDPTAQGRPAMTTTPPGGQPANPADAFDQYLASVEQGLYAGTPSEEQAAFAEAGEGYRAGPIERPRHRGRLVQVGGGLALLAVCVGGALAWKGSHGGSSGPITVLADKTPLKVQPAATDGVEIPDQNKQIYDRNAKDGQIKIVNREEQPLDVNQAARTAAARNEGTPAPAGQGGATPGQGGLLTDSLGEPRRVRTVAVKPDTPTPAQAAAQAVSPVGSETAGPTSPIPTMTLPEAAGGSTPAATPRRPARTLASAAPMPVADAATPAQAEPAPAPAPRKAPQRVASVETTASTPAEPVVDAAPAASQASVGGFSVQLGVRGSESEARAAFRQMQSKYSQLSGKPELIRQAEVNGKTIYRVRVGPLAKNEASSLCTELQGAGGQCFVAKN